MRTTVRTTITLPEDLLEQLRAAAYTRRTNLSALIREGVSRVVGYNPEKTGMSLKTLKGKYHVQGKRGQFSRREFYAEYLQKNMPA